MDALTCFFGSALYLSVNVFKKNIKLMFFF